MENIKIAIIGGGNLGRAIAEGFLKSGEVKPENLTVTRRRTEFLEDFKVRGVQITRNNQEAALVADVIFLSVKPFQALDILREIKPVMNSGKVLVSMVAGVGLEQLQNEIGENIPVFRAMPNTAISLQESMTCISTNGHSGEKMELVLALFNKLGETAVIAEELMGAATVIAACGIAFALRYIRAAMQGGIEIGFNAEMAQFLTAQTVKGATRLVMETGHHPEQEIDKVTTPRGVTITGLNEMEHKGFSSSLIQGLIASYKKIDKSLKL
jgi:pyrroline-5-carboxylate reductase